nr:aminotransferase class V-fold PLP-dependent enzyme [Thermoanaerobaculia bacterium]
MTTQVHRIYNFSAGPATMPLPVLEQIQRDLLALPGVGMSVLEISHRSKPFQAIIDEAVADARELAGIPENYKILF